MKTNKIFAGIIILWTLLAACRSSPEMKITGATKGPENNIITFNVNGIPVKTGGWNISRFNMGRGQNLNITTDMHTDGRTVMLNLRGCRPGIYSLDEGASGEFSGYGDYKPDYHDLLTSYRFEQGRFTITAIDTAKGLLNASFSGTVRRGEDVLKITDGRIINGTLNKTVQSY